MDYEQKYAKALWQMKELYNRVKYLSSPEALLTTVTLEKTFPELKESEDERIRDFLIGFIKVCRWAEKEDQGWPSKEECIAWLEKQGEQKSIDMSIKEKAHQIAWETSKHYDPLLSKESWCEMAALDMASWLEKQGEQKPTWSEEDEKFLNYAISLTDDVQIKNFLKSLKDKVQLQPKQEWSKDDKEMIRHIRCYLNEYGNWLSDKNEEKSKSIYKACDWLESIEPNHWKPSEEQMEALKKRTHGLHESSETRKALESLINDLKKL